MEKQPCYQCGAEILADCETVHTLCDPCRKAFTAWFEEQLAKMGIKSA